MDDPASHVFLVPKPGGEHLQHVFYWHGDIDHTTEEAANRYADNLLAFQQDMGEDTLDAIFVWNTRGGEIQASEGIKAAYKRLGDAHIRVWTVVDNQALSAGSHLVAGGPQGRRFAMPHARLGIHSIDGRAYFRSIVRRDRDRMVEHAEHAGYRVDDRRRDFIHVRVARLDSKDESIAEEVANINKWQSECYAAYSTALKNPLRFELMTLEDEMTYLDRHAAAVEYGLIDREQVPRWLHEVVRAARNEAANLEPHERRQEDLDAHGRS